MPVCSWHVSHPAPARDLFSPVYFPLSRKRTVPLVFVNILLYTLLGSGAEVICFKGRCFFGTQGIKSTLT